MKTPELQKQAAEAASLTNRERFCKLYDFEKVDRPTHWEAVGFWDQTVTEWNAAFAACTVGGEACADAVLARALELGHIS